MPKNFCNSQNFGGQLFGIPFTLLPLYPKLRSVDSLLSVINYTLSINFTIEKEPSFFDKIPIHLRFFSKPHN